MGRALTWADPKIIDLAQNHFIPVAADDWYQRRRQDDEGEFFRKVADQGPRKGQGGGTRQGMAISWPARIKDAGGVRNQFHHVIDIVPTILEATGVKAPQMVDGIKQKPMEGVSMVYTFDKANADAASTRKTQYFEMIANRGIYHDGWLSHTVHRAAW